MDDEAPFAVPINEVEVTIVESPTITKCQNCNEYIRIGEEIYWIKQQRLCKKCGEKSIKLHKKQGFKPQFKQENQQ